ncbi:MAG: DUF3179 domain-containing protein [Promethearchaeota archaeon]
MYKKYILVLGIIVIGAIIYGIFNLNPQESLEIQVKETLYSISPENSFTNATIEFNLTNPTPNSLRLRNVAITSKYGENELGTGIIDDLIIEANSKKEFSLVILEDWSDIPSIESEIETGYEFRADKSGIIGNQKIEINDIKPIPRIQTPIPKNEQETDKDEFDNLLDEFYANIRSGGPPKDGIPPIDNPKYESVSEADEKLDDEVLVYPQRILVWHEIVNEEIDTERISITYCPLTGSAIGYYGKLGIYDTSYGTSGKLINSNLVMYDRETDSYWPQILGTSIHGLRKGESLNIFNIVWTKWSLVKEKYPDAQVLSEDTGFFRRYGDDPYGIYSDSNSYYNSGNPFFPVMHEDNRLEPKEVVTGIIIGANRLAIPKQVTRDNLVINTQVGEYPLVAIYDESFEAVRVFSRNVNGIELNFSIKDGEIIDQNEVIWSTSSAALTQDLTGTRLEALTSFDVMWFAWTAFYPDTELIL